MRKHTLFIIYGFYLFVKYFDIVFNKKSGKVTLFFSPI